MEDYLKAVDLLTINDDGSTLQKQVVELTEKSEESNYIIKGKLVEKERQFEELKERLDSFEQDEYLRKEHEAELNDRIEKMIFQMDSMIAKIHDEANPTKKKD